MKIQIFSTHNLFDNRISRHIITLLKYNYKVDYVNTSNSNENDFELRERIDFHHIKEAYVKSNIKGVFKSFISMLIFLKNGNADIVHIHDPLLIPLLYYAKHLGKSTVYDKHECYEKLRGVNSKIGTYFEKVFKKHIDAIVYVNEQQFSYINSLGYKIIKMIPNYQSITSFNIVCDSNRGDIVTIIYIGALSEKSRNILLMLDVMEMVLEKMDMVRIVLGGKSVDESITNRIDILSGKYRRFEYRGVLKYSDVIDITLKSDIGLYFVKDIPNNYLSSPNKIYEYMIAGLVLVGMGKFTHSQEIDGYAGKIFPFESQKEDIVSYICSLIKNKTKMKEMKSNARNIGLKYTWESVEYLYKEIYDNIDKHKRMR